MREMGLAELRSGARMLTAGNRRLVRQVVERASVVCPNSDAEASHLANYLGVRPDERWVVVRNGIWQDEISIGVAWRDRPAEVLCLGGLSPRKNSLLLVQAAREAGIPLRIVGQAAKLDATLARLWRRPGRAPLSRGFGPGVRF